MRLLFAVGTSVVCLFFVFWFVRLLVVTDYLRQLRPGGGGAYVGAVVFPLLAIIFGWLTVRLRRRP